MRDHSEVESQGGTSLALMSGAEKLLARATTVQKAKELKDLALTAQDWARRQKKGEEIIDHCRRYSLLAERRMGELLKRDHDQLSKGARGNPGGRGAPIVRSPDDTAQAPTLAALGVSKRESSEAQKLADLDPEKFDEVLDGKKTLNQLTREQKFTQEQKRRAKEARNATEQATIQEASAIDFLKGYADASIDMLLTDPPYSTDVPNIEKFSMWVRYALPKLKPAARAYICIGAYPVELHTYLHELPLDRLQILVWTYRNTLGPTPKDCYKLNWQAILYLRGPEAAALDCPIMTEQFSVQDINAPDGRQGDRFHAWQKPDELAERFIRHSTKPGDLVVDPFAGTGTFLLAAARLGRKADGCDSDPAMLKIAKERGCKIAG